MTLLALNFQECWHVSDYVFYVCILLFVCLSVCHMVWHYCKFIGCRSETCCTRPLKIQDAKIAKNLPSEHHHTTLSGYIFATKAHVDNRKKNLLSSNISSTCPYNIVNFGPLAAESGSLVWGTPANFNGFRVLAALLHGTLVVGVSQTLWRWTEGAHHLYSEGDHHVGHWPTF